MSNILKVSFAECGNVKYTNPLYQYDYGQILKIEGLDLPFSFQAHFCNDGDLQTITAIGEDNEVEIPNMFLQTGKGILCYIYLHAGEDDGETEYKIIIPVTARPEPSDEEPTPVQQGEIDQLIIALNNAVDSAETYAGNAQASAENAYTSELNAKSSEDNALLSEQHAKTSEDNAKASEDNAKASEDDAALSAEDASTSATNAAGSERLAKTYSENASQSASEASGYASTAQGILINIQRIVNDAIEQAKQSGDFDGVGIASIVFNPDYTLTITLTDGTSTTTGSIRGEQGEQGETGATGATGVGISSIYKTGTSGNVDTYTILYTDGNTTEFEVTNGSVTSVNSMIGDVTLDSSNIYHGTQSIADVLESKAGILEDTVSGDIVTFVPDKTIENIKGVSVEIDPVQDLHGYDKPWPAGGGVNKMPPSMDLTDVVQNGVTLKRYADGHYHASVAASRSSSANIAINFTESVVVNSGMYFVLKASETNGSVTMGLIKSDNTRFLEGYIGQSPKAITSEDTVKGIYLFFASNVVSKEIDIYPMFTTSNTVTDFSPYSNECPISGWEECKVTKCGKNIVDISEFARLYPNYCTYSNNTLTVSQGITSMYTNGIDVRIPSGYTISCTITEGTATNVRVRFAFADGTISDKYQSSFPYTTVKDIVSIRFNWSQVGSFEISNFQAEKGSTATTYEPYQGTLYTISLGQTVYGGRLDVVNGALVIDRASFVWDGSIAWTLQNGVFVQNKTGIKQRDASDTSDRTVICDRFKPNGVGYRAECTDGTIIKVRGANTQIACYSSAFATVADFNASLTQNPMTMVYKLATPLSISLTPQQITSLKSLTTMYADTGSISVDYAADLKTYIQNAIAQLL